MAATSTGAKKKPRLDLAETRPAPQNPVGALSGMDQLHVQSTTNTQTINANNSNVFINSTVNQNILKNEVEHSQRPAPDESKLAFIMENCVGGTVDSLKVTVCEIAEPAGRKQRSKPQFRGSFIVADETAHTLLKVFGPHESKIIALFKPNQTVNLKNIRVNADCLNFTTYSSATKSATQIKIPETTKTQVKDEESDVLTPEQLTKYQGIAKTKVFIEKVDEKEEKMRKKKRGKQGNSKFSMRCLRVKERKDSMESFTLMLFGKMTDRPYKEGQSYVFTKVKYNNQYENLTTVENCEAIRCPVD